MSVDFCPTFHVIPHLLKVLLGDREQEGVGREGRKRGGGGGGGGEGMRKQEGVGREGRKREGGSLVPRLISSYCAREEMRFLREKEPGYEARREESGGRERGKREEGGRMGRGWRKGGT